MLEITKEAQVVIKPEPPVVKHEDDRPQKTMVCPTRLLWYDDENRARTALYQKQRRVTVSIPNSRIELLNRVYGLAVYRGDHIALLQPGLSRGGTGIDVGHNDSLCGGRQLQLAAKLTIQNLDRDAGQRALLSLSGSDAVFVVTVV